MKFFNSILMWKKLYGSRAAIGVSSRGMTGKRTVLPFLKRKSHTLLAETQCFDLSSDPRRIAWPNRTWPTGPISVLRPVLK